MLTRKQRGVKCAPCAGTGRVERRIWNEDKARFVARKIMCLRCGGSGKPPLEVPMAQVEARIAEHRAAVREGVIQSAASAQNPKPKRSLRETLTR